MKDLLSRLRLAITNRQQLPLVIRVFGLDGPSIGIIENRVRKSLTTNPLEREFTELRKTRFERRMCQAAIDSLNDMLVSMERPRLDFPIENFHIMPDDEFVRIFGTHAASLGLCRLTHCYIPRMDDRVRFAATVTHEIVHMACYKEVVVKVDAVVENGTLNGSFNVYDLQIGLRAGHGKKKEYHGLSEAVTEITARLVRENLADIRNPLTNNERQALERVSGYWGQIELFDALAQKLFGDSMYGYLVAFWDYLTGTDCFCQMIAETYGKNSLVLKKMDESLVSAFIAAHILDFPEVAECIKEHLPKKADMAKKIEEG